MLYRYFLLIILLPVSSGNLYAMDKGYIQILDEYEPVIPFTIPRPSVPYLGDINKLSSALLAATENYQTLRKELGMYNVDIDRLKRIDINVMYEDGSTPFSLFVDHFGHRPDSMNVLCTLIKLFPIINTNPVLLILQSSSLQALIDIIATDLQTKKADTMNVTDFLLQKATKESRAYALATLIYRWVQPKADGKFLSERKMSILVDMFNKYRLNHTWLGTIITWVKQDSLLHKKLKETWSHQAVGEDFEYVEDPNFEGFSSAKTVDEVIKDMGCKKDKNKGCAVM